MHAFTVKLTQITIRTWAETSDKAVDLVLEAEKAPINALIGVYQDNPVPKVDARYGAPLGRMSERLDFDNQDHWTAKRVPLDGGGYDKGGAYWGLRPRGVGLFAVQDGMGNIAFVDAKGSRNALELAAQD